MRSLYLLAFLLGVSHLSAQEVSEYISFFPNTPDTCGSGLDIMRPEHFIAYQTIDNTQDGEIDASTCLEWSNQGLLLGGADLSRPVFVRLVDFDLTLPSNSLTMFAIGEAWAWEENPLLEIGNQDFCSNGLCSGMEIEVQIPSEDGEGVNTRTWQQEFSFIPEGLEGDFSEVATGFAMCIPTESFEEQLLQDVTLKIMFGEGEDFINLEPLMIQTRYNYFEISNENVALYQNENEYLFHEYSWEGSADFLFLHDAGGYASEENRSYIDLYPSTNPSEQQSIPIVFGETDTYTLQPYTFFRGGLVEGEETLRHNLSILNEGAVFCFNAYIDVIIQEGWSYTHRSGILDFQGGRACMQLNEGGKMIVEDDYLHYGKVGQGMYALYGGSSILLEENAHLYFDGKLLLANHQWDEEFIPVVMTLEQGAKLSFSEFAKLDNLTLDRQTKLLIYNRGGAIDLTNLSEQERASIEIVEEAVATKHITLLGNPVQENGMLDFMLFEDGPATIRVIDFNGKQVIEQELDSHTPLTHLDLDGLSAGTYLLKVKQQAEVRTERFVIN
ncbi:MAG: T9SS type A sorting domain-containing protein [Flavobacteriales bacterium]|nr:T9SS type A sorting domain-containing protein [Flavobacteriales bacterium]MDG1779366.1 T9SS type A sorting domain-containing protein [Flavobacteriales bacterium]